MEILLFKTFEKRKNSTKVPDDSLAITKNVKLKGECSIVNPSFFLADAELYSYVKAWGNYYFVDRIAYDINGAQYINCSIDVLASWKSQILETSAFVKYSSSDYNTKAMDNRVPTVVDMKCSHETESSRLFSLVDTYMLTTVNKWGGMWTYVLSQNEYDYLMDYLSYASEADELADIRTALTWQFSDFMSAIVSLKKIPVAKQVMQLGEWFLGIGALQVPASRGSQDWLQSDTLRDYHVSETHEIAIPWHYRDFRKARPYSELSIALPFLGEIQLEPTDFIDTGTVKVRTDLNLLTGQIIYTIYSDTLTKPVATYNAICGMDIPLGNVTLANPQSLVGVAAEGIAGATLATMSIPQGYSLATMVHAGVTSFYALNQHKATTSGSYAGTCAEYANNDYLLMLRYYPPINEPENLRELYGRPCSKVREIEGLTGYVETIGFDIDISAEILFSLPSSSS